MAGTKAGGMKAAATNIRIHGEDFYRNIGRKGGRNGHTGGFASNRELARIAGAKGGRVSRRNEAQQWYKKNKLNLEALEESGYSTSEIAHKLGISANKLYYINKTYRGRL